MKTTTLALAVAMAAGTLAHAQEAVQWRVEDGGNGHWYLIAVHKTPLSWDTAHDLAIDRGGHLVTVTSEIESAFVSSLLGNSGPWWIPFPPSNTSTGPYLGGFRASLSEPWQWATGELWEFTAWCSNQPSESFCAPAELVLHAKRGNFCSGDSLWWGDINASGECLPEVAGIRSYLIEYSADCNGDGIVDYGQCRDGSLPDYNGNNIPDCCEQGVPCEVGNYPVQWRVEDGGNGHWYVLDLEPLQWLQARDKALSHGADLSALETTAEYLWIRSWVPDESIHLGGIQSPDAATVTSDWLWLTGSSVALPGVPVIMDDNPCNVGCCGENGEQNYLHLFWSGGVGDVNSGPFPNCSIVYSAYPSLMEWSADCNGDGIVDYGQILDGTFADVDSNGVPDCCDQGVSCEPCLGDVNFDGIVNGADISVLLGFWGLNGKPVAADINQDGQVDGTDLANVLGSWGECP